MTSPEHVDAHVKPASGSSGDEPAIAKVLTIGAVAGAWLSAPFVVYFIGGIVTVLESLNVVPRHPLGLYIGIGGYATGAMLGVLGTIPMAVYAFCPKPRIRLVVAGISGALTTLFWMTLLESYRQTMAPLIQ
jgi:hypothetical protein